MKRILTWLLASFCMSAHSQSNQHYGSNNAVGQYINIRGFRMYYEIYGTGSPLLMIHGNRGSISNFANQIPFFSQNHQVIVADSRAQGRSRDEKDTLSYEMMADDLNALLDSLQLDSCCVLGWSDGGINGLLLAIRHPDKVKKLAVTGANLWPDTTAVNSWVYHSVMRFYTDTLLPKPRTAAIKNQLKLTRLLLFEPHISVSALHAIKCPSLVIGGDHDILLPEHTMLIAKNIPESYLWIVPNSGHSTLVNYKDVFNKTVNDFYELPYRKIEKEGVFN